MLNIKIETATTIKQLDLDETTVLVKAIKELDSNETTVLLKEIELYILANQTYTNAYGAANQKTPNRSVLQRLLKILKGN